MEDAPSSSKKIKKTPRGKGRYCVAYGCTSSSADNVSLHGFPRADKRSDIRKKWIAFVRNARKDFDNPSAYMCLCEKHFEESCYPMKYRMMESLSKGDEIRKKTLLPDAVPTIHLHKKSQSPSVHHPELGAEPPTVSSPHTPVQSKTRSRAEFRKRECARIMEDYSYEQEISFSEGQASSQMEILEQDNVQSRGTQFRGFRGPRRSIAMQTKPRVRSIDVQTDAKMFSRSHSISIQCYMEFGDQSGRIIFSSVTQASRSPTIESQDQQECVSLPYEPMSSDVETQSYCDRSSDLDYVVSDEEEDTLNDSDDDFQTHSERNAATEPKYIVFQSNLLSLFSTCPMCRGPTSAQIQQQVGSMICISHECTCGYLNKWYSQPYMGSTPAGNLLISASILFSGLPPTKALRFLDHMNLKSISRRTFDNHQSQFLHPTILTVWNAFQSRYFQQMREKQLPLSVGGDGRADSPGHCAKFGSYTLLDLKYMAVIDVQLVQSNEVKSSTHMELEGLKRCVAKIKSEDLDINEMVTDRHLQINKYIREEMPSTTHYFDVWHVAKGLKKKLTATSKLKECDVIAPWIRSITNHMYWVPASTPDGHEDTMAEKWLSVLNHIRNVHTMEGKYFTRKAKRGGRSGFSPVQKLMRNCKILYHLDK